MSFRIRLALPHLGMVLPGAARALAEQRAPAALMAMMNVYVLAVAKGANCVLVESVKEVIHDLAHVFALVL